jgi:hypothetical protein
MSTATITTAPNTAAITSPRVAPPAVAAPDVSPDAGRALVGAPHRGPAVAPARARLAPLLEPRARTPRAVDPAVGAPPDAGAEAGSRPARPLPADPSDTAERALPDPTPLCCAMVQAAVEALRGARPLAQLTRWVATDVYDQLAVRAELTQRVLGRAASAHPTTIRRIRLFRLGASVAEATVVVDDGPRVRAVAVRLEGRRGQWRATALEIG